MSIDKRNLGPIYRLYKDLVLGYNRCGTKSKINKITKLKTKLRHRKTTSNGEVLIIFLRVEETRAFRVRAPLTNHLNRVKVVAVTATLVHHIVTKVVEVKLAFVTDRL